MVKEKSALDKIKENKDEDKLYRANTGIDEEDGGTDTGEFKVKDQVPEGAGVLVGDNAGGKETVSMKPREKICAIYDGSIESAIMIHKLAKDESLQICVLQNPKNKFSKIKLDTYDIADIGTEKKDDILDYIGACGEYCINKNITKLYIPWTTKAMNENVMWQDLFMNGVPTILGKLDDAKSAKFVRPVFYNYGTAYEDIIKNKKQYGYE